jgi:uncharacterized protein
MAFIVIVASVSLLIGLSKGGLGPALVVLVTPLLSLVLPASEAVAFSLPLLMVADAFALWMYWKRWNLRIVLLMLPLTIAGILVGTYLLVALPKHTVRHIVGILTLLFIVYKLLETRLQSIEYQPRDWHGHVAGGVAGAASALANAGAVPFTAYMLLQDVSPADFIGTTTLYFALVNALKIPGYVATGLLDLHRLLSIAWAIPLIPLGVWLGRWLVNHMNKAGFERIMLVVLFVTALVLLFLPPT